MEVNLLGTIKRALISRFDSKGFSTNVFIAPITEAQEIALDNNRKIQIDGLGAISRGDTYLYGEVDLDKQDDIDEIKRNDLFMYDGKGMIYTNFNYDKANFRLQEVHLSSEIVERRPKLSPCSDAVQWFKFKYCLIGKPQRVVVFRY